MKPVLVWASLVFMAAPAVAGQRATAASDAVVLIRLTGSVHAQVEELGQRNTIDRERVEIGSGSGFVISPDGYILTNEHVIGQTELTFNDGLRKGTITLRPTKIEVCFPREVIAARGGGAQCLDASIAASEPTLDLALLSVGTSNLPYLALGDSDAASVGQAAQALGFPFGQQLSLDTAGVAASAIPELTTTSGTISAVRSNNDSERRYLQVSTTVNPGNSGGPLIDKDGFVVGVIRARLRDAAEIAFAIPINQAKAFFESRGLDQLIPGRPIRLGAVHNLEAKGMSIRLPEGFVDASPLRARVEAASRGDELSLRIDRVLSPLSLRQLEQQLIGTQNFERLSTIANESRIAARGSSSALIGQETATATDTGAEARVIYTILDLGREKLLARYVGSSEQVAFNESVLRASLASLEGQAVIAGDVNAVSRVDWPPASSADRQRLPPFPAGWIVEPGAPSPCGGLAPANITSAATPPQDFTVVLRAAVWTTSAGSPEEAAAACATRRGSLEAASYASRADWLGVSYTIEGTFVRLDGRRLVQMEVLSTDAKLPAARALLAAWVKRTIE